MALWRAAPDASKTMTDLTLCDREPIHLPGSIQPHGMMLVADRGALRVSHAAGDVESRLGFVSWEGKALAALLGEALGARIRALLQPGASGGFPGANGGFIDQLHTAKGELLDVSAHPSGPYVFIEFEPASKEPMPASLASLVLDGLEAAAAGFEQAATLQALCDRAATEFRRVTGFDRVLVYQFVDDDVGRVLAEDRRDGQRSFSNHHFPASNIPRQARALYVRNLTRVIPDISYQPAPLRPRWTAPEPLDMSDSSLRSVSPIHLDYMKNMGVGASASVSIVKDGVLWGLVACHNEAPRLMGFDVRVTCRALAGALARQIKAKEEAESYRQRLQLRNFGDEIAHTLSMGGSLDAAVRDHLGEVGRMLGADGVAVLRGGGLTMDGVCPSEAEVRSLAGWVLARNDEATFSTDRLAETYLPAAQFHGRGSGLLALTVSKAEPWLLLWFRAEQVEIINWAGNRHRPESLESASPDPAEAPPRASFDIWQNSTHGRARRWTAPEVEGATRLRTALLDAQQTRHVYDLNRQLTETLHDKDTLLEQKEFLMGEVNHRVQNSLQLVSSFLALQARASDSPELHDALEEARRRLSAVGLVHRRLYGGAQVQVIDIARYIEELCADAVASMGQEWKDLLSLDLAPLTVSAARAVTLGLVLTELIINVNKHAYAGQAGPVEIRLLEEGDGLRLTVADRGKGRPVAGGGYGTRIMNALVAQLGGKLAYEDNRPGLRATLTAPVAVPGQPR